MIIPRSPILRLTFWYVLIIMAISVMFSAIIYRTAMHQVRVGLPPRERFFQQYGSRFGPPFDQRIADLFEERYETVAHQLRVSLLIINLAVLAGASFASYFLAKRTLRPIEQALDDQRRFTADASHELRTPLTAMKTEIEVAVKRPDAAEHRRVLASNLEEIAKLEKLSSSLLKLARHEQERGRQTFEPIEFDHLVATAIKQVSPLAKQRQIEIATSGLDGVVIGDRESLTDLLVILLDNAIKYSPAHSTIDLRGRWSEKNLTLTIADQGAGISETDLPHVFDRFYRAERSRSKNKTNGFGLGLSIAKQIVERHQGDISMASKTGAGTTVTVILRRK